VDECEPLVTGAILADEMGLGGAVQVDPMKTKLKALGTMRLTLKYDEPLSSFAFKFDLRRYSSGRRLRRSLTWRSAAPAPAAAVQLCQILPATSSTKHAVSG